MKNLLSKNSALIVSIAVHIIIFSFFLFQKNEEKVIEKRKFFEVGLAGGNGFLNSGKNKTPEKKETKLIQPKKSIQETIPEKKSKVEKIYEDKTNISDTPTQGSSDEGNNNENGSGGRGDGSGNNFSEGKIEPEKIVYFVAVDRMPVPVGGERAIQLKIIYPALAKKNKIEGIVYIRAFIDEYGRVQKTAVDKGIGFGCDEAAQKAVKSTRFQPGYLNNRPVKVQISIPVQFKLQN